jgi:hypothetical protein
VRCVVRGVWGWCVVLCLLCGVRRVFLCGAVCGGVVRSGLVCGVAWCVWYVVCVVWGVVCEVLHQLFRLLAHIQ